MIADVDSSWAQSYSFVPPGHMGPAWTVLVVLGLLGAGYGSILVAGVSLWLGLRRALADEHAMLDGPIGPLRLGPRRVVRGKVERVGGAEAPVEIDIMEMVQDHASKQSKWHTWEETARTVRAEAFRLVRHDGRSVTVEPGQDVLVVDSLVTTYPKDRPRHRVRSAIIAHGAEVHVYGDLHRTTSGVDGPYRESGGGLTLRPPRGRSMLIATQSLRARHDGAIRVLGLWLAAGIAAFVLFHAIVTVPFLLASAFHTDADAWVQSIGMQANRGKNGISFTYRVTVRTEDGFQLEEQAIPSAAHTALAHRSSGSFVANPVSVPIIRTFDIAALSFVGTEPHVAVPPPIVALVVLILCIVIAYGHYRTKLAWYDVKKVTERGGDGYWNNTPPAP